MTSLKEYYFNYARVDGKTRKDMFGDPIDYWFDYKDSVLTLHFTLPLKAPVRAQNLEIDIYDPEFFLGFAFAEDASPGDDGQCAAAVRVEHRTAERCSRCSEPTPQQIVPAAVRGVRRHGLAFRQQDLSKMPVTRG